MSRIREAADIPIIFCTAYVAGLGPEVVSVARAQLIAKPVGPSSLREALAWATAIAKPAEGRGSEQHSFHRTLPRKSSRVPASQASLLTLT